MSPARAARVPTRSVTARAPAKVNLALAVGGADPDGYHALATVFHAVSLYDEVTATASSGKRQLTVEGTLPLTDTVPRDATNIAWRAVDQLADAAGLDDARRDVDLHIRKGIPIAGGMAGGSADAAAALVACDALWGLDTPTDELAMVAAGLGADVPFALHGGTALGVGRGDHVSPVLARGTFHWVLAVSDAGLSTAAVYREVDRLRDGGVQTEPRVPDEVLAAVRSGDAHALGRALTNDLQRAAFSLRPQLSRLLDSGTECGALAGIVSGSGPTVAFLARDDVHALDVAVALAASGMCSTVRRATGPVAGARLVDGTAVG
jgi:4-diphosphocytidyl-2-C-methyl-D-erythritol kinase